MPIQVPQYEGLAIKDFVGNYKRNNGNMKYLPDPKEFSHTPRHWLCTVTLLLYLSYLGY
jgi:hypothetical protein